MGFRKNLAIAGLAGLLALSGCYNKQKESDIFKRTKQAHSQLIKLSGTYSSPYSHKVIIDGEEINMILSNEYHKGYLCFKTRYEFGNTIVDTWNGKINSILCNGMQIKEPAYIIAANEKINKALDSLIKTQTEKIQKNYSQASRDIGVKSEKNN